LRRRRPASLPATRSATALRRAEARDEREDRCSQRKSELLLAEEGEHGALEPDHCSDERVDEHEQRELAPVGA
jgi:hypothetical protein